MESISIIISTMAINTDKDQLRVAYESAKKLLCTEDDEILIVDDTGLDRMDKSSMNDYYSDYNSGTDSEILKIIYHHTNLSLLQSRYTGIKNAKNKFLVFLDCDDYFINQDEFIKCRDKVTDENTLYYFHQSPNYYSTTDSCINDMKHKVAVALGLQKITLWGRIIPKKVALSTYKYLESRFGQNMYFNLREDYLASITMIQYYDKVIDLTMTPLIYYSGGHMCLGGKVDRDKYLSLMRLKGTIISYSTELINKMNLTKEEVDLMTSSMKFSQDRLFSYYKLDEG